MVSDDEVGSGVHQRASDLPLFVVDAGVVGAPVDVRHDPAGTGGAGRRDGCRRVRTPGDQRARGFGGGRVVSVPPLRHRQDRQRTRRGGDEDGFAGFKQVSAPTSDGESLRPKVAVGVGEAHRAAIEHVVVRDGQRVEPGPSEGGGGCRAGVVTPLLLGKELLGALGDRALGVADDDVPLQQRAHAGERRVVTLTIEEGLSSVGQQDIADEDEGRAGEGAFRLFGGRGKRIGRFGGDDPSAADADHKGEHDDVKNLRPGHRARSVGSATTEITPGCRRSLDRTAAPCEASGSFPQSRLPMGTVLAIFRRELRAYFNTPLGYIVVTAFLLAFGGWFFYLHDALDSQVASMRPLFDAAPLLLAIFCPLVTMRLLAEERATGTLELLVTLPVREWEIVVGKYLAALAVVVLGTLGTLSYPLTLLAYAPLDLGPVAGGYVGLVILAAAYCAVGLAVSVGTANQIVAALAGLFACFGFWVADKAAPLLPAPWARPLYFLGFDARFGDLQRGVIDTRDLLYFGSVVVLCLCAASVSLRARRLEG